MVTIYSKPACPKCIATKRYLEMHGVDHEVLDVSKDPAAMDAALAYGIREMPIVVWDGEAWGGFDDKRMQEKRNGLAA